MVRCVCVRVARALLSFATSARLREKNERARVGETRGWPLHERGSMASQSPYLTDYEYPQTKTLRLEIAL